MTAHVLSTELSNIISETKRKNNDIRNAAEKSLQDLKAISVTSEAQLAGDLRRRPLFLSPFVLSGKSNNAKLALYSVTAFQRLIAARAVPQARLKEVLESLQDSCRTGLDVQLKILQCLPQLVQLYGDVIEGELQADVLQVCSTLQQVKTVTISSTASATFQQIVTLLYEKVEQEDVRAGEIPSSAELKLDAEQCFVRPAAYDAYRVLEDICSLVEGQKPRFVKTAQLTQSFGLNLVETLLNNHGELFMSHPELAHVLRTQLMPLVTRILSERLNFNITVRTCRILCILLREHLDTISVESEIPLSLLHHSLDADVPTSWRRALTMEVYRVVYSTPNLAMQLYTLFDQQPGRVKIIQDSLGSFVRLAAEKPALIGLGSQSTFPSGNGSRTVSDRALLEASSVAGIITTGDLAVQETAAPGISVQWSTMKTPCLDHVDKVDAPTIPDTYSYSMVLACLNGLSDNMARVVLPLGVPESRKKDTSDTTNAVLNQDVVLDEQNSKNEEIDDEQQAAVSSNADRLSDPDEVTLQASRSISHMVDSCWPAILASSSTFLYAALDADFYKILIRSFQRFTQIAGLLQLSTPRDAFLTTLAKAAVPANVMRLETSSGSGMMSPRIASNPSAFASVESFLTQASTESPSINRQHSFESSLPSLTQRNLMCLRALINLAIALGAILESSWIIILQNLQRADTILAQTKSTASSRQSADLTTGQTSLGSEITALEAAIGRLFQSTASYSDSAFLTFLTALCDLLPSGHIQDPLETPPGTPGKLQRSSSMGGQVGLLDTPRSVHFTIAKLGDIARINISRLAQQSENSAWRSLADNLMRISTSSQFESTSRLMAADVLGNIAVGAVVAVMSDDDSVRSAVQLRALDCLDTEIARMCHILGADRLSPSSTDLDVHRSSLEALRAILEQCGDTLIAGWKTIFAIVQSAFIIGKDNDHDSVQSSGPGDIPHALQPVSPKIARAAFASVQLICSDFLPALRKSRIVDLIEIMTSFCTEYIDLNVSLTTITLFWEVSDFLRHGMKNEGSDNISAITHNIHRSSIQAAESGSVTASWLVLLYRLAAMTADNRADIRVGAVQTVFRILDNSEDSLSPELWELCWRGALLEIVRHDIQAHTAAGLSKTGNESTMALVGTSRVIVSGLTGTLAREVSTIRQMSGFDAMWSSLHDILAEYVLIKSSALDTVLYESFAGLLTSLDSAASLPISAIKVSFSLWAKNVPVEAEDDTNDKAVIAYLAMFNELYRLHRESISDNMLLDIISNLEQCARGLKTNAYTTDVDSVIESQAQTLQCLRMLQLSTPEVASKLISTVAGFVTMPYSVQETAQRGQLSYVAFSKASMTLLLELCDKYMSERVIFDSRGVESAFGALAQSIRLKYKWTKQGKVPSMWSVATTCAVQVVGKALPAARSLDLSRDILSDLYKLAVDIVIAIGDAYLTLPIDNKQLLKDETFDQAAFEALSTVLLSTSPSSDSTETQSSISAHSPSISWLGSPTVSDDTRQTYVSALTRISLIHDPASSIPSLNASPDQEASIDPSTSPLALVHRIRPGRTFNPTFTPRLRMSYLCLDYLAALVSARPPSTTTTSITSANDNSKAAAHTLGTAAFPYLVLRLALPLQRYVADQPLRGRMPTPASQRLELLCVLRKARELQCASGVGGVEETVDEGEEKENGSEGLISSDAPMRKLERRLDPEKRHLEWLVPLVSRVGRLARHDKEIADACMAVMDAAVGLG